MSRPAHNTDALVIGTGEFSFSEGATSVANATLRGFRDVGNVVGFQPQLDVQKLDHKGSNRGQLIKDKSITTEQGTTYIVKMDEWKVSNLLYLFAGTEGDGWTQVAYTGLTGTQPASFAFTSDDPSGVKNWHDIRDLSGERLRFLTSVDFVYYDSVSATCDATANTIGATAHGLSNGDRVFFTAAVMPTGLTANTAYYVVNTAADTFKVAATSGGSAIDFSTAGTTVVFWELLEQGTHYAVDLVLGRVQFAASRNVTIHVAVTAPVITSEDDLAFLSLTPLQNLTRTGYGRVICFDQGDPNNIVYDHADFKCEVSVESAGEINGTSWSEIQIRVSVDGQVPGTVYAREGEPALQ